MIKEHEGRFILDRTDLDLLASIAEGYALAHSDDLNADPIQIMGVAIEMYTKLADVPSVARCVRETDKIERRRTELKREAERKSRSWLHR